jgi:hypothetical protein
VLLAVVPLTYQAVALIDGPAGLEVKTSLFPADVEQAVGLPVQFEPALPVKSQV